MCKQRECIVVIVEHGKQAVQWETDGKILEHLQVQTSNAMPWRLVIAGCIGMFAATATGSTRSPFLPDIAADLNVSLPAVANLFGVTATFWGISSYLAGSASDRIGRRALMVIPLICLALVMFSVSQVQSYWMLVALVATGGMCCGTYTAAMLAEVSMVAHSSQHGRAFGYVMTGQSLTLLVGVPLAAWLGGKIGWRGLHMALAALALISVACIFIGLGPKKKPTSEGGNDARSRTNLRTAFTGPVTRLFVALIAERLSFGLSAFYYASFLRDTYKLPIDAVALPLFGFALGNIVGTVIGGHVADRFPYRRISFAAFLIVAGCIAIPWFTWHAGVRTTVLFGVAFAFFGALSRPSLLAALAEVPEDVRGLVMGLNSSIASVGWLAAALIGGWLYAGIGFAGFGPLMAAMCIIAALVVVPDSKIKQRKQA